MGSARTLYDKAAANFRSAQTIWRYADGDEEQLNAVGYHLQQCFELALKYLLEQNGLAYPKTHDIDQLIRLGRQGGADLLVPEYLDDHAEMFSQWEAKSRYVLGYAIEARKIERALAELDSYLALIAEKEAADSESSEAQDGRHRRNSREHPGQAASCV